MMTRSFKRIAALTGRNVKEIARDPLSLATMFAMPLLMLVLFYFIFHNLTAQFEIKYLAPSVAVFAQAFLTLFVGILISTDRATSFLTRLYVSPAKSREFISAYTLALVPAALAQTALMLVVGGILDPSFFTPRMLLALLLSLPTSLLFIGLGILLGTLCNEKSVGGVSSVVIVGQSVLSGMWFPLEGLGDGVITLMNVLPFRNASQLMMHAVNGASDPFADVWRPLLIVLAYTIAAFVAAVLLYRAKMKRR